MTDSKSQIKLYIDGASRNNPGHSGAGVYIIKNEQILVQRGFYLGVKTNNQAEYMALLLGIYFAKKHIDTEDNLVIVSDSLLLVNQLNTVYSVKNPELKKLYNCAIELLSGHKFYVTHVLREHNKNADRLANHGIDKKLPLPEDFLSLRCLHENK